MDMSYDVAQVWNDRANLLLVISLVLGLVATFLVVVTGNIKEEHVKKTLAESHERAAALEKDAAVARLETERLKSEFAWRKVTSKQEEILRSTIGSKRIQVTISWMAGDAEGSEFARSLAGALQRSGCEIAAFAPMTMLGREPHGLALSGSRRGEVALMFNALESAGLGPVTKTNDLAKSDGTKYFTHIMVGYRSPPFVQGR